MNFTTSPLRQPTTNHHRNGTEEAAVDGHEDVRCNHTPPFARRVKNCRQVDLLQLEKCSLDRSKAHTSACLDPARCQKWRVRMRDSDATQTTASLPCLILSPSEVLSIEIRFTAPHRSNYTLRSAQRRMLESQQTPAAAVLRSESNLGMLADRLTLLVKQDCPDQGPDLGARDSAQEAQEPGEGARRQGLGP